MDLSIIIPTLNEREGIEETLAALERAIAGASLICEIILVDGGSEDGTVRLLEERSGVKLLRSAPGRALQMNAGAEAAGAPWLLFLHADTLLEEDAIAGLGNRLKDSTRTLYAFELRFRNEAARFRRLEAMVAWRSRTLGLPYGDQGLCVHRSLLDEVGGFRQEAPMEDLDFVLRVRSHGDIRMLPQRVHTSTRQWDRQGFFWGTTYNAGRMLVGVTLHYLRNGGIAR